MLSHWDEISHYDAQLQKLMQNNTDETVLVKLMLGDFLRTVPSDVIDHLANEKPLQDLGRLGALLRIAEAVTNQWLEPRQTFLGHSRHDDGSYNNVSGCNTCSQNWLGCSLGLGVVLLPEKRCIDVLNTEGDFG